MGRWGTEDLTARVYAGVRHHQEGPLAQAATYDRPPATAQAGAQERAAAGAVTGVRMMAGNWSQITVQGVFGVLLAAGYPGRRGRG